MGFFSIIRSSSDDNFNISSCHINFWVLPDLLGDWTYYWDVGLEIIANETDVSEFRVALPFETQDDSLNDLSKVILDPTIASLIFGKPVTINHIESSITIMRPENPVNLHVYAVSLADSELDAKRKASNFSLWTIKLSNKIPKLSSGYVRIRFKTLNAENMWSWKQQLVVKSGAIADFRISDVRGSVSGASITDFQSRIIPIDRIFLFLVAPSQLQLQFVSPTLHDTRLYEGQIWEKYLGRAADIKRNRKFMIYQWREGGEADQQIDDKNAFRAFIDLNGGVGLLPLYNHFITSLVTLALIMATYFAYIYCMNMPPQTAIFYHEYYEKFHTWINSFLGLGFIAIFTRVTSITQTLKRRSTYIRRKFRKFQDWVFRVVVRG